MKLIVVKTMEGPPNHENGSGWRWVPRLVTFGAGAGRRRSSGADGRALVRVQHVPLFPKVRTGLAASGL